MEYVDMYINAMSQMEFWVGTHGYEHFTWTVLTVGVLYCFYLAVSGFITLIQRCWWAFKPIKRNRYM